MRGFIVCCIAVWLGPAAAQTGAYDDLPMDVMEHGETPRAAVSRIRTGGDEDQTAPFNYRPTAERSWSTETRQLQADPSLSQADFAFLSASEPADFDGEDGGDDRDKDQEHDERDAERDRDRAERDAERNEDKEDKDDEREGDGDRDDDHGDRDGDRDDDGDDGDDD